MRSSLWALRLRYFARRVGWPALAGLVLFGGAAVLHFDSLPAARAKLAGLRAAIVEARAQRNTPRREAVDAANLLAALPGRDAFETTLAAIHQAVAAQGLAAGGAEYRVRKEAGGELLRYELTLPLKGAYAPLRAWLAELSARQPALAIDELSLHREGAEKAQVDGRLRLALFLRARAAAAAGGVAPATLPTPQFGATAGDLFAARSWQPPPPPPPPPPKPTAPPLPFRYTGKLVEEQGIRVFLSEGNATSLVKQGDKLGSYDVERVTPSSVVLLFRPLQQQQTLNFGGDD